ncbi:hypothetical protein [Kitasatospora terrestris]|uniref:hypothetical protein n=1 Tax=Kitasatospora terrestris TaxID=258051 RepID=UPI0031E5031B
MSTAPTTPSRDGKQAKDMIREQQLARAFVGMADTLAPASTPSPSSTPTSPTAWTSSTPTRAAP